MTEEIKQWAVVDGDVIVDSGFGAPQSYVDNYTELIVDRLDLTTPPWYHEGITFLDVTDMNPRPVEGWFKVGNGPWINGAASLTTNRPTIPADGNTSAKVTFAQKGPKAPANVNFDINGQVVNVALVNGAASVDVISSNPGDVITVTVGTQSVSVNVTV